MEFSFQDALENLETGSTLTFEGMTEEELDEFAGYANRHGTRIEAGTDDSGRTHIRKHEEK